MKHIVAFFAGLLLAVAISNGASAADKSEIDTRVKVALKELYEESAVAKELSARAKGILVFPRVYKAGFIGGAEYGEGALRIGPNNEAYYSTASASFGFQFGAQARTQVLMFLTDEALSDFRNSDGWEIGVDGSVALVKVGAGKDFDTNSLQSPIVGFVTNNEGLMVNVSLEGTKISRINR